VTYFQIACATVLLHFLISCASQQHEYYYREPVYTRPTLSGYIDNQNGTISDPSNGLLWAAVVSSYPMSYVAAKYWVASLNIHGRTGWRLPTRNEFSTHLVNHRYLARQSRYKVIEGYYESRKPYLVEWLPQFGFSLPRGQGIDKIVYWIDDGNGRQAYFLLVDTPAFMMNLQNAYVMAVRAL